MSGEQLRPGAVVWHPETRQHGIFVDEGGSVHTHDGDRIRGLAECANRHVVAVQRQGTPCPVGGCGFQPGWELVS